MTVILVTHDMAEAFALGHRVGVIDGGALIACDTPAAIAAIADPRVRALRRDRSRGPAMQSMMRCFNSGSRIETKLAALLLQHATLVLISTTAAIVHRHSGRHPRRPSARARPRDAGRRQRRADHAQPCAARVPAAAALHRRHRAAHGAVALSIYALLPIVRTTVDRHSAASIAPSSRPASRWA